jgi:hypothetical protein
MDPAEREELIGEIAQVIRNANSEKWPWPQIIPAHHYAEAVLDWLIERGMSRSD